MKTGANFPGEPLFQVTKQQLNNYSSTVKRQNVLIRFHPRFRRSLSISGVWMLVSDFLHFWSVDACFRLSLSILECGCLFQTFSISGVWMLVSDFLSPFLECGSSFQTFSLHFWSVDAVMQGASASRLTTVST